MVFEKQKGRQHTLMQHCGLACNVYASLGIVTAW